MSQDSLIAPLEKTFRHLVQSRHPTAAAAVAYAVLNASGEARNLAIRAALEIQERSGLEALIRIFHELSADVQAAAVSRADVFLPVLRQNAHGIDRQLRANTCDFLIRMDDTKVAYLLADLMQDPADDIKRSAQEGLLALAHRYHVMAASAAPAAQADSRASRQALDTRRYALLDALLTALKSYKTHERPEMIAMLMSLDPRGDEVLMGILANPMDRRRKIVLDILEASAFGRLAAFVLSMLKEPASAAIAVELLEKRSDEAWVAALLQSEAALGNARVQAALPRVKIVPWLRASTDRTPKLHPRLAVRAIRHACACGIPAEERKSILERLSHSPNVALATAARFVIEAEARGIPCDRIDAGLSTIESRCPALPPAAEPEPGELVGSGRGTARLAAQSPPAAASSIADTFETLTRAGRDAAIAELKAKGDLLPQLQRLLASPEPDAVLRAIKVVEWAGCQADLARELAALTRHGDARLRSAAVKQLGKSAALDAVKALFETLNDRDKRVLANAVEALETTGHKQILRLLEPLMQHPDNRVRANAAKAAWTLGDESGRTVLAEMLKNPKPQMRLSGLWGLRQIGAAEAMPVLREMARSDSDDRVRKAAQMTLAELENAL